MKIFLDTNVLLAATLSSNGASAQILKLCEADFIQGYISSELFEEALEVIARKFPGKEQKFKRVVGSTLHVEKIPSRSPLWKKAASWIQDPDDIMVLVGAKYLDVDWLITLDLRDFIRDSRVAQKSGLKISTPGDFLEEYRRTSNT
jgi:predicted nucleic acid-binding protein